MRTIPRPTERQAHQRRQDLPSYLRAIRRSASLGARASDGIEAEVHEHFVAICAHVDDAFEALGKPSRSDRVRFARDDALQRAE